MAVLHLRLQSALVPPPFDVCTGQPLPSCQHRLHFLPFHPSASLRFPPPLPCQARSLFRSLALLSLLLGATEAAAAALAVRFGASLFTSDAAVIAQVRGRGGK